MYVQPKKVLLFFYFYFWIDWGSVGSSVGLFYLTRQEMRGASPVATQIKPPLLCGVGGLQPL